MLDIKEVKPAMEGTPWMGLALAQAGSAGLGALSQIGRAGKQHERQKELMDIQLRNQRLLNKEAFAAQLQQWKDTSYPAQKKLMQEAGLNPGLMYGQAGAGGTTGSVGAGSAAGGQAAAPMDIGSIVAATKAAAEIALLKAQASKTEAEEDNLRGEEGTIGASQIESNLADALNKQSMAKLNNLGFEIGNATKDDQIDQAHYNVERTIKENNLTDQQAELARVQVLATGVKMQLDKANINLSETQAKKLVNDIRLGWEELSATLQKLGIDNQANKLRALEGKTKLQGIANDFILGVLGKEIDLHKLNIEQQKIFTSMFNTMLIGGSIMGKAPTEIHNY